MSYEKVTFQPYDTLTAKHLNDMQDAIIEHNENKENPHEVTAEQIGAAKIEVINYVGMGGNGEENNVSVTFNTITPKVIFVNHIYGSTSGFWGGTTNMIVHDKNNYYSHNATLNDKTFSWSYVGDMEIALNAGGEQYTVIGIG